VIPITRSCGKGIGYEGQRGGAASAKEDSPSREKRKGEKRASGESVSGSKGEGGKRRFFHERGLAVVKGRKETQSSLFFRGRTVFLWYTKKPRIASAEGGGEKFRVQSRGKAHFFE